MGYKVNYIHEINFINLFHTPREQGNQKNKAKFRKMWLRLFPMSQDAYHALVLDNL